MKKFLMMLAASVCLIVGLSAAALAAETITSTDGVTVTVSSRVYKTETITVSGTEYTLYTIPDGTFLTLPEEYGNIAAQYNSSSEGSYYRRHVDDASSNNVIKLADDDWRKYIFGLYPLKYADSNKTGSYETCAPVFFRQCDRVASDSVFVDVQDTSAYYFNAVMWGYETGRTNGTDATHFSPTKICTRAEMVTFLWRAMGSPEPTSAVSPFVDVQDALQYYYKAVLWASENGVTTGTDATHFSPDGTCVRAQAVTFLFRMYQGNDVIEDIVGKTTVTSNWQNKSCPFKDVATDAYYYDAVRWAYYGEITSGTSSKQFSPDNGCERAQIMTFVYRTASSID